MAFSDTLDQMDFTDVYRIFNPKATKYTLFLNVHGTFFRIDHILVHKTSLRRFKEIEIIPSIFSNHTGLKLQITYKKKTRKFTNMWRQNNVQLNN